MTGCKYGTIPLLQHSLALYKELKGISKCLLFLHYYWKPNQKKHRHSVDYIYICMYVCMYVCMCWRHARVSELALLYILNYLQEKKKRIDSLQRIYLFCSVKFIESTTQASEMKRFLPLSGFWQLKILCMKHNAAMCNEIWY